ncbi:M16 family metallopeptidase [Gemmatimonas groenlandica]|uniref:Insulinase family protein n=1 Tax=Gemmatimonas groenlandica TaxID=2732249 RepID=A0A6M4ILE9_9BACT|nr:pitrilysin family protein [Gemmatimonas groenlandica]QJR34216.1 insulinase family protein [Gemmatimonas groenlandica]
MTSRIQRPSDALALHHETVREILPNGLTLLVRRDPSAPVVAIVTHVKVGYFDEADDVVGIAHVLEHMFFKGTPTRGVGQIARETKANGGYLNAHTIYDHTTYYTVLPSSSFVQGLEIQFDAYARSIIDAEELARELEVIIEETKRKRDTASAMAIETLYATLFDKHRIRRWRMGDEPELRALTREQLMSFYKRWYRPDNTVLSIVGDVDIDEVRREVASRHGQLDNSTPPRDRGPIEVTPPGFRLREWSGDIAQQHVAFGWRTPSLEHIDTPALDLAGLALGSGRASRFYRAIRERQLASAVSAWDYTAGDIGVFVAHTESPAEHAREATRYLWRELQAARTVGFRRSEVARAQSIIEARWLRRLESMDGQATYLASWEAEGGLDLASRYYDALLSLSPRDLQDALAAHLDPEQLAVISYRPNGAAPLAEHEAALRDMLRAEEGQGSSVLVDPGVLTPMSSDVIDASAVHVGLRAERVERDVHVYRTAQGVPVLVLPRPGSPLVNVGVFQRGGSCVEPTSHEGLSRITAQAMLKGTERRSGARIAELAEELGSSIGVSAALESIGWTMSVPVRHFPAATELLGDVLQHPVFPDEGVSTERALALAEVTRARDDMSRWPMRLAAIAAYGAHPYARSVIGTEASLALVETDSVRGFHADHIARGASVIAVVGDVTPDDVAGVIDRAFPQMRWQEEVAPPRVQWPHEGHVLREERAKKQTALAMLFPGPSRYHDDRFAARVLSAVASGLGGRFFEQLRDKQSLAYTVSAFPIERRAGGVFAAYIATSPSREQEARDGLLGEFAKLCDAAPTDDEMERARRYLIGTHAIAQQSGGSVLGDLVDAWLFGEGLHERHEVVDRLAAVQGADVLRMARASFDPSRVAEGVVRGSLG